MKLKLAFGEKEHGKYFFTHERLRNECGIGSAAIDKDETGLVCKSPAVFLFVYTASSGPLIFLEPETYQNGTPKFARWPNISLSGIADSQILSYK